MRNNLEEIINSLNPGLSLYIVGSSIQSATFDLCEDADRFSPTTDVDFICKVDQPIFDDIRFSNQDRISKAIDDISKVMSHNRIRPQSMFTGAAKIAGHNKRLAYFAKYISAEEVVRSMKDIELSYDDEYQRNNAKRDVLQQRLERFYELRSGEKATKEKEISKSPELEVILDPDVEYSKQVDPAFIYLGLSTFRISKESIGRVLESCDVNIQENAASALAILNILFPQDISENIEFIISEELGRITVEKLKSRLESLTVEGYDYDDPEFEVNMRILLVFSKIVLGRNFKQIKGFGFSTVDGFVECDINIATHAYEPNFRCDLDQKNYGQINRLESGGIEIIRQCTPPLFGERELLSINFYQFAKAAKSVNPENIDKFINKLLKTARNNNVFSSEESERKVAILKDGLTHIATELRWVYNTTKEKGIYEEFKLNKHYYDMINSESCREYYNAFLRDSDLEEINLQYNERSRSLSQQQGGAEAFGAVSPAPPSTQLYEPTQPVPSQTALGSLAMNDQTRHKGVLPPTHLGSGESAFFRPST